MDDVMTTGSTLNECARVLRHAGVARVDVWVLARARAPGQGKNLKRSAQEKIQRDAEKNAQTNPGIVFESLETR